MEKRIGAAVVRLALGDITRLPADAIVNAANSALAGGGGVDGAIHRAGGPQIMSELELARRKGGCPTGSAVITGAGMLPARHVVHAVGPVWRGGKAGEDEALASAYDASLRLASKAGAATVTMPAISTGVYCFPLDRAAGVALGAVAEFLRREPGSSIRAATFVLYEPRAMSAFEKALLALEPDVFVLYRPVGPKELKLIEASDWREFPPRLPEQPLFYPVLNEEYAIQIARDWNMPQDGAGFVTRFRVSAAFAARYPPQIVGGSIHQELWIPAADVAELNSRLLGLIEVIREFRK